jgi:hypothetical protein
MAKKDKKSIDLNLSSLLVIIVMFVSGFGAGYITKNPVGKTQINNDTIIVESKTKLDSIIYQIDTVFLYIYDTIEINQLKKIQDEKIDSINNLDIDNAIRFLQSKLSQGDNIR